MFGFFKKDKERRYDFECPMCNKKYEINFDSNDVTEFGYEFANTPSSVALIGKEKCDFCKTEMAILYTIKGKVFSMDEKWKKVEKTYYEKFDPMEDEIFYIEEQLEEASDNEALNKKLTQLKIKLEKMEASFDKKEEKYTDRQCNWQEKMHNKFY